MENKENEFNVDQTDSNPNSPTLEPKAKKLRISYEDALHNTNDNDNNPCRDSPPDEIIVLSDDCDKPNGSPLDTKPASKYTAHKYNRDHRSHYNNKNYGHRSDEHSITQKLHAISGSTVDIKPFTLKEEEMILKARTRLFIGNLTSSIDSLRDIFKDYGAIDDIFLSTAKKFALVKMDPAVAVKAKRGLDGLIVNGKPLRIRYASNTATVRVSNLSKYVSNELLYKAFEVFGSIEMAIIKVDDRGNHMGEGIVEFHKKHSANSCLRLCQNMCYYLTASMHPCIVEPLETFVDVDGLPEKALVRTDAYERERSTGPHLANTESFQHSYGMKWKRLHQEYNNRMSALKREFDMERKRLDAQYDIARAEQETHYLRRELRARESNKERLRELLESRGGQEPNNVYKSGSMARSQRNVPSARMQSEELVRRRQLDLANAFNLPGPNDISADARNNATEYPFQVFGDENVGNSPENANRDNQLDINQHLGAENNKKTINEKWKH